MNDDVDADSALLVGGGGSDGVGLAKLAHAGHIDDDGILTGREILVLELAVPVDGGFGVEGRADGGDVGEGEARRGAELAFEGEGFALGGGGDRGSHSKPKEQSARMVWKEMNGR